MAKKKEKKKSTGPSKPKGKILDVLNPDFVPGMDPAALEDLDPMDVLDEMTQTKIEIVSTLIYMGVTPDEYTMLYNIYHAAHAFDESQGMTKCAKPVTVAPEPLKDALDRTLLLKISMQGVEEPPMWREVEVPAWYMFRELHEVIQIVTGLDDDHLWEFYPEPNKNKRLTVAPDLGENIFSARIDKSQTLDADETELTQFLRRKGKKMEYVYDFGDDWHFTIEVKEVLKKSSNYPVCTGFEGSLNVMEDTGGLWSYLAVRDIYTNWDKLSEEEREDGAFRIGIDDADIFMDCMNDCVFNLEKTNEQLADLE